nr:MULTISPECIES: hypothetical protein [unclassified Ruegeria]
MLLSDHVGDLDTIQRSGRGCEGFEPTHMSNTPFYQPMILLDHVIQKFGPDCLHLGLATKPLQNPLHFSNTGCVGSALIDEDFVWDSV